jgi:hypothetical protein
MYFISIKPLKEKHSELVQKKHRLDSIIQNNDKTINILRDSIEVKEAEIRYSEERIGELETDIYNLKKKHKEKLQELEDYTLEQVLDYILDYYDTDSTEACIRTTDKGIEIVIQPRLVYEWTYTIEKLESTSNELILTKNKASEYSILTEDLKDKINLLEGRDSVMVNSLETAQEKNGVLQQLIENRDKRIKQIKTQRNIVAGVAVIIIVISLI